MADWSSIPRPRINRIYWFATKAEILGKGVAPTMAIFWPYSILSVDSDLSREDAAFGVTLESWPADGSGPAPSTTRPPEHGRFMPSMTPNRRLQPDCSQRLAFFGSVQGYRMRCSPHHTSLQSCRHLKPGFNPIYLRC
jgi:hypothetical protein